MAWDRAHIAVAWGGACAWESASPSWVAAGDGREGVWSEEWDGVRGRGTWTEGSPKSGVRREWSVQREWDGIACRTCVLDQEGRAPEEVVGLAQEDHACDLVVVRCSRHVPTSNGGQAEWGQVVLPPKVEGGVCGPAVDQERGSNYRGWGASAD